MFGWIMPAPLAMPVALHLAHHRPAARVLNALATVSVVMIASAARAQWSACRSSIAAGRPGLNPVERQRLHDDAGGKRQHLFGRQVELLRQSRCRSPCVRARPSSPVPAFALPVLITIARMPRSAARCSRQTCTGAAQKRFCVNTPATPAPFVEREHGQVLAVRPCGCRLRRRRCARRAMGCSAAGSGGERLTGMETGFPEGKRGANQRNAKSTARRNAESGCGDGSAHKSLKPASSVRNPAARPPAQATLPIIRSMPRPSQLLHPQREPAPLKPAATVMLLRDGLQGVEVLMTRRSTEASFAPGAYVFPGGAIDPQDAAAHAQTAAPPRPVRAAAAPRRSLRSAKASRSSASCSRAGRTAASQMRPTSPQWTAPARSSSNAGRAA